MGDPNGSLMTCQPLKYRPQYGSFGANPSRLSYSFVNKFAIEAGLESKLRTHQTLVPVKRTRTISKRDMVHNSAMPNIEIDPESYNVYVDGKRITVKPARRFRSASSTFSGRNTPSMPVITEILFRGEDCPDGLANDPVHLTSEERSSPHMVLETVGGRVLRISLPERGPSCMTATFLRRRGIRWWWFAPRTRICSRSRPTTQLMWGVAGFHLGNLHRPCAIPRRGDADPGGPEGRRCAARVRCPLQVDESALRRYALRVLCRTRSQPRSRSQP